MSKPKRTYLQHSQHTHPQTKEARAQCRRIFDRTGEPWDGSEIPVEQMTKGEKSAATRRRRQAEAEQTSGMDALLDASMRREAEASVALDKGDDGAYQSTYTGHGPPPTALRDSHGHFTKATLAAWSRLIEHLEGAQDYIAHNGIELTGAMLTTSVGGQRFVAEFDGDQWYINAEPIERQP